MDDQNIRNAQSEYFQSYGDLEVHHLMLQDKPRNEAYRKAIFENKNRISGKIVLDVGAGTGILSVFCAQAGAAKVYAVEASNIFKIAEDVIKENEFEDVIQIIHGKIEDITLPNNVKVDVIVSEWMGFYLLHEAMLDSIIFARDKFLKDGGFIFPETATIYSAPCSLPLAYNFWENICGVAMKRAGKLYRDLKSLKPEIMLLDKDALLHEGIPIAWFDLQSITMDEVNSVYHQLIVSSTRDGDYQAICLWFTVQFPSIESNNPVILSTAPYDAPTHWKQTVIVLPTEMPIYTDSPIAYELLISKSEEDKRKFNIEVTMLDPDDVVHPEPCNCYMTKCILIKKMIEQYQDKRDV